VLALLYDVHGNLAALDAVVADAESAGAERFVLGGDYALFGPQPAETVARLRELGDAATWIRGNGERWTASPDDAPDNEVVPGAIVACRAELGDVLVDELAALPEGVTVGETAFVHGSPVSDVRSFMPEPMGDEEELLAGVVAPRLVFGHTHLTFARQSVDGRVSLVNPGSVGMPFDGDIRAAYALLHDDGRIEHRRVRYDNFAAAASVRDRFGGGGWAAIVASRIETAKF
jgi:predicted phosphodiesterase